MNIKESNLASESNLSDVKNKKQGEQPVADYSQATDGWNNQLGSTFLPRGNYIRPDSQDFVLD